MVFRLATLLISLFPFFCCASDMFSGHWSGADSNDDGTPYSTLTLKIHQSGNRISGQYCFITQNGNRIDCPTDDEENLHGVIKDNKAKVTFDSSFGGKGGVALLLLHDSKLSWHLKNEPQQGNFYAPDVYELTRQNDKEIKLQKIKVMSTKDFTVTLVSTCGDFNKPCQDVEYYGLRNKDQSRISLKGHTVEDANSTVAKGMLFKNGNIEYLIDFEPLKLKVLQGTKILVEQDGRWE
ncbi:hypothetical protein PUG81_11515 [Erwiniaceae bacterium L1_54_6]|jgi:hypothetical protein|nr:hypothetical protein [Erwiniaceae bacterium L1_54_6]